MTILYHYCSNNSFHSIIEKRRICLSSLSMSNDSMEGKLVAEILVRLAKADKLDQTAVMGIYIELSDGSFWNITQGVIQGYAEVGMDIYETASVSLDVLKMWMEDWWPDKGKTCK